MKLEFFNSPQAEKMDKSMLPEKPEFMKYEPDFELMEKYKQEFAKYKNILIIAHGGSITTFYGYYAALGYQATKKAYFLSTTDPDYIYQLKQELKPEDTLVIPISKSGETTTQIEALMQFADYPMLMITGKSSTLRAIGEKLNATIALHPVIGGRYTGLTEVALLPAALCGLDVRGLYEGAKKFYNHYEQDNEAWRAASVFWQLEQKGFVDVFMPFYAHNLFAMSNLIVQLCHESFGKQGKGQTYFAHEAPESQHHTNQRFFGGQKNISGFFTTVDNFLHPTQNIFPPSVHSVQIKGHSLFDINKIPLEKSMEFEALGTMEDAKINGIPFAHISMAAFIPEAIGQLVAFWQLYAVYSSVLRNVDPFDQPQVESSKLISFNKRLAYKGLL
jgi:glucose-6-phosphate isomerase